MFNQCSITHNSQGTEATQCPLTDEGIKTIWHTHVDKENVLMWEYKLTKSAVAASWPVAHRDLTVLLILLMVTAISA